MRFPRTLLEFQALFHWHVADLGMEPVYIKPRTPQLNGKVERSHRTDKDEFYQLLTYRDDVDLEEKLAVWERLYDFDRPQSTAVAPIPLSQASDCRQNLEIPLDLLFDIRS